MSIAMPDFKSKRLNILGKPLVGVRDTFQPTPPARASLAARRLCRGEPRILGLIIRGQVLDSCPPAVLFYPIRISICWPTQLLSGAPPTHTGGALCASVCVLPFVAVVCSWRDVKWKFVQFFIYFYFDSMVSYLS